MEITKTGSKIVAAHPLAEFTYNYTGKSTFVLLIGKRRDLEILIDQEREKKTHHDGKPTGRTKRSAKRLVMKDRMNAAVFVANDVGSTSHASAAVSQWSFPTTALDYTKI